MICTGMRYAAGCVVVAVLLLLGANGAGAESLWEREQLTGDWGGARAALKERGIELGVAYIGETLSILRGGLRQGTTFEGRLDMMLTTDLEKLVGWTGASTQVRAFQIHNRNNQNAADFVGSLADPSNIDATRTTRLFTAWFQQDFGKSFSIRAGQLAADDEFLTSVTAGGLINGTFGWATMMASNLPSGGAAYPLATPGIRMQFNATENVSFLAAVFSGDPAGRNCVGNLQICNRHGTTFSLHGEPFWIAETQYQVNQGKDATGLAAAYKLGAWYHATDFNDQRYGIDPATGDFVSQAAGGDPIVHRGNWGVYAVIDQMLWRGPAGSLSVFARGGASPSDRNLVSWYVDGGIGIKGLFAGRPDDTLTLGVAHSRISRDAAGLDNDTLLVNGPPYPIRSGETVFELSYILQLAPWWSVQPDVQYIVRPGGNVPHPDNPAAVVENAWVVGARTSITF